MSIEPVYLGDSVYADFENSMIKLYTDNGLGASNIIWIEPEVFGRLLAFAVAVDWLKERKSK